MKKHKAMVIVFFSIFCLLALSNCEQDAPVYKHDTDDIAFLAGDGSGDKCLYWQGQQFPFAIWRGSDANNPGHKLFFVCKVKGWELTDYIFVKGFLDYDEVSTLLPDEYWLSVPKSIEKDNEGNPYNNNDTVTGIYPAPFVVRLERKETNPKQFIFSSRDQSANGFFGGSNNNPYKNEGYGPYAKTE